MLPSSTVSPDHDIARITSSLDIIPRSPCEASLGCTKNAVVPVEENVAAILWPTWPDLPIPVTMTRPVAEFRISTARENAPAIRPPTASSNSASPWLSSCSVRLADFVIADFANEPSHCAVSSCTRCWPLPMSPVICHARCADFFCSFALFVEFRLCRSMIFTAIQAPRPHFIPDHRARP